MRLVGLWVLLMINVMFFGMAGYMYLLWVQYWRYSSDHEPMMALASSSGRRYNVSRAFLPQVIRDGYETIQVRRGHPPLHPRTNDQHVFGGAVVSVFTGPPPEADDIPDDDFIRGEVDGRGLSKKRRNKWRKELGKRKKKKKRRKKAYEEDYDNDEEYDEEEAERKREREEKGLPPTTPIPDSVLKKMLEKHKTALTIHLRTSQMDGGNILFKHENKYGVVYPRKPPSEPVPHRSSGERALFPLAPSREALLRELRSAEVRALRDGDEPFTSEGLAKYFPSEGILEGRYFNSCAVVSSAGSLRGSRLGKFIDSHDAVVRFNHAPTRGYRRDVGSKTTLRIVNTQVVTKSEFRFGESALYKNVTLLVWDPCNYTDTLQQWYQHPDFDFFQDYFRRRLMLPQESLHLLNPHSLWAIWRSLQKFTHTRVLPNPPSSGFLGIMLMLAHCRHVNVFEFIPSLRITKRCHYWDPAEDSGCTFGAWHPLATEKLLTLVLNEADDITTFRKGYASLRGFSTIGGGG